MQKDKVNLSRITVYSKVLSGILLSWSFKKSLVKIKSSETKYVGVAIEEFNFP